MSDTQHPAHHRSPMMDDIDIPESQKNQLHEVADLLLETYRTLLRMRYLRAEWIDEGPHDLTALLPLYESLGIDPAIVYLYHILPYVDALDRRVDYFQGGQFADFRNPDDVRQARDPLCNAGREDEGEYPMQSYMTALSFMSNDYSAIIYSAKDNCIWIRDQQSLGGGGTDPGWQDNPNWAYNDDGTATADGRKMGYEDIVPDVQVESGGGIVMEVVTPEIMQLTQPSDVEPSQSAPGSVASNDDSDEDETPATSVEGEDDEDEGDMDWSDDEDEENPAEEYWSPSDARPADTVLRDINRWYRELREIPGGGEETGGWDEGTLRILYRKHGWPGDAFDGMAFEVDQIRKNAVKEHDQGDNILDFLFEYKRDHKDPESNTNRRARELLADDSTVDNHWEARWMLATQERNWVQLRKDREQMLEKACPNGLCHLEDELPLLEVAELEKRTADQRAWLEARQRGVEELESKDAPVPDRARLELAWANERAVLFQRAWNEAKADAQRLRPGKTANLFDRYERQDPNAWYWNTIESRRQELEKKRADIAWARDWLRWLPDNTDNARQAVERWFAEKQKGIDWDAEALERHQALPNKPGPETEPVREAPRHPISSCEGCLKYLKQRESEWLAGQNF